MNRLLFADHGVCVKNSDSKQQQQPFSSEQLICKLRMMLKLFPSSQCIKSYLCINGPLIAIGCIFHLCLRCTGQDIHYLLSIPAMGLPTISSAIASNPEGAYMSTGILGAAALETVIFGMKNFLLLFGIDYLTSSRLDIIERLEVDSSDDHLDSHSSWKSVISSVMAFTIIETITYNIALVLGLIQIPTTFSSPSNSIISFPRSLMFSCFSGFGSFILISFIVEIIFDFFHYWSHRFLHLNPVLYRSLHSLHHHNSNPTVYHTFNDSICGTILTNTIPHLLALWMLSVILTRPISHLEHSLLLVYKTFVEVSGHSGKELGKASSFPQCKWLPTFLSIELYTCDHHSHHRNAKTNFSKRFVLWDKLFGTYLSKEKLPKIKETK